MKKNLLVTLAAVSALVTGSAFVIINSSGIAGQTGSPGEQTCSACHSGGTSMASGATITASPAFSSNAYVPGQTYTINVIVGGLGFSNFGFGCEILNSSNSNAGTMQNAGTGVQFMTAGNGRNNAVHTTPKSGTGFATFSFEWVAPASGVVNIYASGNCVNLNGNTSGDLVVTASLSINPQVSSGVSQTELALTNLALFPNPTSGQVNLNYSLMESADISIDLVAIDGSLVANLLNEKQQQGYIKKNLRLPSNISSGVYFIKVSANGNQVSQRLVTVN